MINKKTYTIGTTLNLNINSDDNELNDFLYIWDQFESRPNKIIIHNTYIGQDFMKKISQYIIDKNVLTELIPSSDNYIYNERMCIKINDNLYISFILLNSSTNESSVNQLLFYYKTDEDSKQIEDIITEIDICILDNGEDIKINKLNTIFYNQNNIELEPLENKINLDNIESYYNSDTMNNINSMIKTIKKSNKGLSILYSDKGMGKSSMIYYISENLDNTTIFIPNNMIENVFNNPDFRKILNKYNKPLLILDDCEMIFSEYYNKSNLITNNLLQMIDGLLSDVLNVNIITIFNTSNIKNIDHNLLESNNLLKIIQFNELNIEESNNLSELLGRKKQYKNNNKLINIIKKTEQPNKKFGIS